MVTELAHGKFKCGLFSRVISCHDRSAHNCQNSCSKCQRVHRIRQRRRHYGGG